MNLLFICSRNQWRSPTAEAIFKNHAIYKARSAGTEKSARIKVSQKLLDWADIVFVMEKNHKERLEKNFSIGSEVIILEIPDEYKFMDPELIDSLKTALSPYVNL